MGAGLLRTTNRNEVSSHLFTNRRELPVVGYRGYCIQWAARLGSGLPLGFAGLIVTDFQQKCGSACIMGVIRQSGKEAQP